MANRIQIWHLVFKWKWMFSYSIKVAHNRLWLHFDVTTTNVMVERMHVGDLYAVGWGEGSRALVALVKATWMGVGFQSKCKRNVTYNLERVLICRAYSTYTIGTIWVPSQFAKQTSTKGNQENTRTGINAIKLFLEEI